MVYFPLLCLFKCFLKLLARRDAKSQWLYMFDLSPLCVLRGCIFALLAFVCPFSTVCLQMCPQIARMRRCITTQAAFVRLFSSVRFHVCPQMNCLRWRIVTKIAFVWYDIHVHWIHKIHALVIIPWTLISYYRLHHDFLWQWFGLIWDKSDYLNLILGRKWKFNCTGPTL